MNNFLELDGIFSKGYGIVSKLVMTDNNLSLGAKGVYSYLCSFSGKGNDAFPSRNKMCFDLKISNDTLGKFLKELKNDNYILISQEKINGKFQNNVYKINLNLPCTKISDTVNSVYGKLDTNNNIYNNNINYNNNNIDNNKEINISNDIFKEKPKKSTFIPPTLEEVKQYCKERNNNVDSQAFYDYYSVADWKDSQGNKIKNWKQKIITWEKKNNTTTTKQVIYSDTFSTEGRRQFNDEYFKEHPY